jgi:Rho-binding antiterminator
MTCDEYDYIEIACLFKLDVELRYPDALFTGKALDTKRGDNSEEGIELDVDGQRQWHPLATLKSMRALTANPHFDLVEFKH